VGTGVKGPGRCIKHSSPSNADDKERVELYLYFLSGPTWRILGRDLPFAFLVSSSCKAFDAYRRGPVRIDSGTPPVLTDDVLCFSQSHRLMPKHYLS
jgi:hypothetical protein